jgi:hypothetical protein
VEYIVIQSLQDIDSQKKYLQDFASPVFQQGSHVLLTKVNDPAYANHKNFDAI